MALNCAASKRHRRHVSHVTAFHPSYQETVAGELKGTGCPVQIVWCR